MFCEKCGARMEDDAVFCEKCGAKVEEAAENTAEATGAAGVSTAPDSNNSQPVGITLSKKQLAIIAAAAVVIIAAVIVKKNWKYTVNLNDFISVEYSGYDSVGTASFSFDEKKFNDKYSGKIKELDADRDDDDMNIGEEFSDYVEYCFTDYQEGLSNGEEIKLSWSDVPEDEICERFNCKVKYEDMSFTVENLKEVTKADPFEKVEVTFEGISPNGRVNITNNNTEPLSDLNFMADKTRELSNGDEIVIKAQQYYGGDINEYLASNYGLVLSQSEKTYKVEGLDSYVSKKEQLSKDVIEQMKSQANDVITAVTAQWNDRSKLKSSEYVGYYLLAAKDGGSSYRDKNAVYMIYKLTQSFTADEYNPAVDFSYYYTVKFTDVLVNEKGECSVDINDYDKCSNRFESKFKAGSSHNERSYYEYGYKTLDDFVQKCINASADRYTYETSVKN